MGERVGWRSFWWLNAAVNGLGFLALLVMFPETKWHRKHTDETLEGEARSSGSHSSPPAASPSADDVKKENNTLSKADPEDSGTDGKLRQSSASRPYLHDIKGRPGKKQWRIFQPASNPIQSLLSEFILPWKLFLFPIVQFASFLVSWSCSCFLIINLTQSQAFSVPPYSFGSESIGFMNFAILIGAFIGLFTAGPLSDWVSTRLTTRNTGVREPEMRLITFIPYTAIMILGNFVVGFGFEYHWDWKVSAISTVNFESF